MPACPCVCAPHLSQNLQEHPSSEGNTSNFHYKYEYILLLLLLACIRTFRTTIRTFSNTRFTYALNIQNNHQANHKACDGSARNRQPCSAFQCFS
ncbi:hypothetical protein SORBI_3005G103650 [Sorghum bicolor]|uniref:Uncharacterized protein n=1 Tax=Sorghum bicolor TaxID=4558 RepID=A0A1Z5RIW0_SORBI|nr:hypothetical protein SORBI_3005G103650 [Sorghum bicolor]